MAGFSVRSERAVSGKGAGELELCKQRPEGVAPAWPGVPCSAVQASALWDGLPCSPKRQSPEIKGSCGPASSSGLCWIRSCPLALCEAPNVFCIVSFRSLKVFKLVWTLLRDCFLSCPSLKLPFWGLLKLLIRLYIYLHLAAPRSLMYLEGDVTLLQVGVQETFPKILC